MCQIFFYIQDLSRHSYLLLLFYFSLNDKYTEEKKIVFPFMLAQLRGHVYWITDMTQQTIGRYWIVFRTVTYPLLSIVGFWLIWPVCWASCLLSWSKLIIEAAATAAKHSEVAKWLTGWFVCGGKTVSAQFEFLFLLHLTPYVRLVDMLNIIWPAEGYLKLVAYS